MGKKNKKQAKNPDAEGAGDSVEKNDKQRKTSENSKAVPGSSGDASTQNVLKSLSNIDNQQKQVRQEQRPKQGGAEKKEQQQKQREDKKQSQQQQQWGAKSEQFNPQSQTHWKAQGAQEPYNLQKHGTQEQQQKQWDDKKQSQQRQQGGAKSEQFNPQSQTPWKAQGAQEQQQKQRGDKKQSKQQQQQWGAKSEQFNPQSQTPWKAQGAQDPYNLQKQGTHEQQQKQWEDKKQSQQRQQGGAKSEQFNPQSQTPWKAQGPQEQQQKQRGDKKQSQQQRQQGGAKSEQFNPQSQTPWKAQGPQEQQQKQWEDKKQSQQRQQGGAKSEQFNPQKQTPWKAQGAQEPYNLQKQGAQDQQQKQWGDKKQSQQQWGAKSEQFNPQSQTPWKAQGAQEPYNLQKHGAQEQQQKQWDDKKQSQHKQQEKAKIIQAEGIPSREGSLTSRSSNSSVSKERMLQQSVGPFQRTDINLQRGTKGRVIKLEANYLNLLISKMIDCAYHYDVKFEPDKPKRFLRLAFLEYCNKVNLPKNVRLAFDGKCNVYSPIKLDNQYLQDKEVLAKDEYGEKKIKVTLMPTINLAIDLKCLKEDYRNVAIYDKPMRAVQCLDVVLRSPCYGRGVLAARAFYNPPNPRIDLTEGYELWFGLFQAAVLGERPLLNIDICHRSFASGISGLEFIKSMANPRFGIDLNNELDYRIKQQLNSTLKGLQVIYKPPKSFGRTSKLFRVNEVKNASCKEMFTDENNQKLSVADYFRNKNNQLQYPKLPCLWVGNREKNIYIPIEFIEIERGQVNLKKAGRQQVQMMIKTAATSTSVRKQKIMNEFNRYNHNEDPTLKAFQIQIAKEFVQLEGRVIPAPTLKYSNGICKPREGAGSWDPFRMKLKFLEQSNALKCVVLSLDNYVDLKSAKDFGDSLSNTGKTIGVNLSFIRAFKGEYREVEQFFQNFKKENIDMVIVILPGRFTESYAKVKQLAENKYGLLTQCIKADTVVRRNNLSTQQNILLKVNAKLNGSAHILDQLNNTDIMATKDVMLIGADVTHPSPEQRCIPSVVGVAASHDLNGVKYNIQWRLQDPKQEMISKMDDILEAHLKIYQKHNKNALPKKIIYYRDGVSDGQFPQIKEIELNSFNKACSRFLLNSKPYRPDITCIIVQKRHRTRFFPKQGFQVGRYENVPAGTIVDTVITHPNECQFFMVSHESIQGTAKPTKYAVIRDDSKFNIDSLQSLTHDLCHLFTRCNRAVSYPAPAYYAHLVAYRGRVYIENSNINLNRLDREYESRKIKNLDESNPMFFV